MNQIVQHIHRLLIDRRKNIAVAESCTGGLLSCLLTRLSGSSKYFILGVVVYSNASKTGILKIPDRIISRKGAVSKSVAQGMAKGVRILAKTDFGIGITGIAGPTGGLPGKPAGTVFIAIDSANKKICRKFHFRGNRTTVREKAALKSLGLLQRMMKEA